jgi:hypothetical protein
LLNVTRQYPGVALSTVILLRMSFMVPPCSVA